MPAESYPLEDDESALLLAAAARFEKRINGANDDVLAQAEIYFDRAKLFAMYGKHEEAVEDYISARTRLFMSENSDSRDALIEQINLCCGNSLRMLGLELEK